MQYSTLFNSDNLGRPSGYHRIFCNPFPSSPVFRCTIIVGRSQGRHFGPFAPDDLSDIVTSCLFIKVFLDFTMEIPTSKYSPSEFPGINKALWFTQIGQRKILFLNIVHGLSILQSGKSGGGVAQSRKL